MAERLLGGDNPPYPVDPEEYRIAPNVSAGQYVYAMADGTIHISPNYDPTLMYSADTVGIAIENIYTTDRDYIRTHLDIVKDRGTVFQDRYEETTGTLPVIEDFQLNQMSIVSDPVDPQTTINIALEGTTQNMNRYLVNPEDPNSLYAVRPPDTHPGFAILESSDPTTGINTTRLNNTADAIDPELIRTMKKENRFPRIDRVELDILKELQDKSVKFNGQYMPCFGCENSRSALFPGEPGSIDDCGDCYRDTGRGIDRYMAKGIKKELYKQFAEEVVPVIKKQAIFEAKQRISEAEEKENKSKRIMVKIAKKR